MSNLVLIVTDSQDDAESLRAILPKAIDGPFDIELAQSLAQALARLEGDGIDIILMDFFLPDSNGIATFDKLFEVAAPVPIMTMVSEQEVPLARKAVQRGAQGYILKGYFHSALLPQALLNTIQRKQVEDTLFIEKERAAVTLDSIVDGVISTDSEGKVTYLNGTAERMTGWSRKDATGHPIAEVFPVVDNVHRKYFENPVAQVIREARPLALRAEALLVRRDGYEAAIEDSVAPIYDRRGKIHGAVIVFRDIGPAQALMVQKMTYQAHHDFLTDLPNRVLLNDRLEHAIALARRSGTSLAVLFLDLDNFKYINDSHGHAIGDQLLASVAKRLLTCIRASDTVSRVGGDEFVILVTDEKHVEAAANTAEKIIGALTQAHRIQQYTFHTTASIGISTFPADGQDVDALLKNADTAMYYAKKKGRNTYQFFNAEMNRRAVERQFIEGGLRHALEANEFSLYYQPKINLKTGLITGVEALIRWQHPERGLVLPSDFVLIAEDCGLILPITRWVLREACRQTKIWVEGGLKEFSTAVNVSALAFRNQDFLHDLEAILAETGLDPACLELELTESVLMPDSRFSNEILHALKNIGVKLAIDDFGTGYSSLSYLQEFPIDVLKIDQSFVRGIPNVESNCIIVTAMTSMGLNLTYRVIAEGIETREQFSFLHSLACDEGQGNYFSPPLAADRCTRLLGTGIAQSLLH